MIRLTRYSYKTHQGPYLTVNEDSVHVDIVNGLYLVCDGIGGAGIGDQFSKLIIDTIKNSFLRFGKNPDSTLPFFYSPKYLIEGNALINALYHTHDLAKKQNHGKDLSQRGAGSCVAVSFSNKMLTLSSVGNCIAYLYRNQALDTIIHPDSLDSIYQGTTFSPYRTTPMSGIGLFKDLHFQIRELLVQKDDMLLLLTDGAYSRISKAELTEIVSNGSANLEDKINSIFSIANKKGNLDNQSAILLNF